MNPYDVLNVRDNATDKDIEKAYRFYKNRFNLKEYSGDLQYAQKRLEEVEKAYNILSNPVSRRAFDTRHHSHVQSHVVKKDVYQTYYQPDPIGTHYHKDYALAMKRYNESQKPSLFNSEAIKTKDDYMFNDESIQEYASYNKIKTGKNVVKYIIFFVIASILWNIIYSIYTVISEIFGDATYKAPYSDMINSDYNSNFDSDTDYNSYYSPYDDFYYDDTYNDYEYEGYSSDYDYNYDGYYSDYDYNNF